MSQTAFSHDIRILACQRCGAAVEGGLQGGTFTCQYCNAVNQFAARVCSPGACLPHLEVL